MPHRVRRRRSRRLAPFVFTALAVLASTLTAPAAAAPGDPPGYLPPVDAPVADPFRAPERPYGAGNRGLQYDTEPGTEVRASSGGRVTFAGSVAGTRHVTILHPDGLRTSYSFLDDVAVVVGQRVEQGDVVGTTVDDLHLGARLGDAYLDPAALFEGGPPQVHLVPFEDPPGPGPTGERSALRQLVGGIGGALGGLGDAIGGAGSLVGSAIGGAGSALGGAVFDTAAWLVDEGPQLLRTFHHYATRLLPAYMPLSLLYTGYQVQARARAQASRPCSQPGAAAPPPPERRVALLVAGLGSTSENGAIDDVDAEGLGYDAPDVLRFSYEGGRTPDPTDGWTAIEPAAYDAADSQIDLRTSGARLADLIEEVAELSPGTPIDLYAHSQGGLVTRLALVELEARHGERWLSRLGLVATLGTPHGGADLATAVYRMGSTRAGSLVLDGAQHVLGIPLDDDAPSSRQLAESSDVIQELADSPIPPTVRSVSIAARGDLVVPVPRTAAPGATEVVVPLIGPSAHDALPGSAEAGRELALALAGLPPTCQSLGSALADQLVGEGISLGEDALGALGWFAGASRGMPFSG